ncbi:MAG TPA: MetQ/NlpA family ABC transporter substrate-binding protein [Xanthobacteraceae bacterium]|nr:MetQ/NlpA family ABC transporter substrate-binding protein [Xanthobacteraceae bacterium]
MTRRGGRSRRLRRGAGADDPGSAPRDQAEDTINVASTVTDIIDNPKKPRFVNIDAAQLPRSPQDVDLVTINNNYAGRPQSGQGCNPRRWVNIIAVGEEDKP